MNPARRTLVQFAFAGVSLLVSASAFAQTAPQTAPPSEESGPADTDESDDVAAPAAPAEAAPPAVTVTAPGAPSAPQVTTTALPGGGARIHIVVYGPTQTPAPANPAPVTTMRQVPVVTEPSPMVVTAPPSVYYAPPAPTYAPQPVYYTQPTYYAPQAPSYSPPPVYYAQPNYYAPRYQAPVVVSGPGYGYGWSGPRVAWRGGWRGRRW